MNGAPGSDEWGAKMVRFRRGLLLANPLRITSVRFSRYKAFRDYSVSLERFNILVGPNNAGKSTILSAFRILAEALRRAKSKSPTFIEGPDGVTRGYQVNLGNVPIATENIFHEYNEMLPASVTFRVSSGDRLVLFFPSRGTCYLICESSGRAITSPSAFKKHFDLEIGFVPTLGPVEHEEPLYQQEAAREALLTHGASRNFRNIWYHYPEFFPQFRQLITETWPGMDIKLPEVDRTHDKALLRMFCPEDRIDREIFWAGFGFQVWCQMLTFIVANRSASLFLIDEPDIYLHSDLQRQLVGLLRSLGPDILLATHSTEIMMEAEHADILLVSKENQAAKRLKSQGQLQSIFSSLGSSIRPVLTQIGRSKMLVFVEGKDFHVISQFAAKLGVAAVANRSRFAVIPAGGFNPTKARAFKEGVEETLGTKVSAALIFDRDYRSEDEVAEQLRAFRKYCDYAHIHSRKELENFLLVPDALDRAIAARVSERSERTGQPAFYSGSIRQQLEIITDKMKNPLLGQLLTRRPNVEEKLKPESHRSTMVANAIADFDNKWIDLDIRLQIVHGKEVLAAVNEYLQSTLQINITATQIIDAMLPTEIPDEMKQIVFALADFCSAKQDHA
jgi:energy-coupling factor transporter ATP-binding protein EcfA2